MNAARSPNASPAINPRTVLRTGRGDVGVDGVSARSMISAALAISRTA